MDVLSRAAAAGRTTLPLNSPATLNDAEYRRIFSAVPLEPGLVDMIQSSVQLLEQAMKPLLKCPKTKKACDDCGIAPEALTIPT
ncbi:UNVERIFIED_CONTAM: hypothetical protein HHA_454590 [Hammondia hammondi]|eukprot:XP_008888187.1 hypothetical protein HHA_454590 [Hammondia hammondi]